MGEDTSIDIKSLPEEERVRLLKKALQDAKLLDNSRQPPAAAAAQKVQVEDDCPWCHVFMGSAWFSLPAVLYYYDRRAFRRNRAYPAPLRICLASMGAIALTVGVREFYAAATISKKIR